MGKGELQLSEITAVMEDYLSRNRPFEEIRHELDLAYRVEGQSVFIFEIRPRPDKKNLKMEIPIAKATYVKSKDVWKVFWMRANMLWFSYEPNPTVKTLRDFTEVVEADELYCFFG